MKKFSKTLKCIMLILSFSFLISCASGEEKIFDQALAFQKNEKYEEAIKMYNEIIDKYPQSKFVANSNVKLNQCIDLTIKQGDDMVLKKDYFKAVVYYENALKLRANNTELLNKINKTKDLIKGSTTASTEPAPKTTPEAKSETAPEPSEKEYKIAIDALNKYKGKKIQDFSNTSTILSMMMNWESAWESKNINIYDSYYDTSFVGVSGGKTMNYDQWIQYKNNLFDMYTSINVDTKLIDAVLEGNKLKVHFEQWFEGTGCNAYSDHTYKELIFEYTQSEGWLIVSEKPY